MGKIILNGIWDFPEQMNGSGKKHGFIYIIVDKVLERFYIGRKIYKKSGYSNDSSNWKAYKSSSPVIKEHFKERPLSDFSFICIEEYETKGGLAFAETWSLCHVMAPLSEACYNRRIEAIKFRVTEPVSERHRLRLLEAIPSNK